MFGDGPESIKARTMHRDLETEVGLLEAYYEFVRKQMWHYERQGMVKTFPQQDNRKREDFLRGLYRELWKDLDHVTGERTTFRAGLTNLIIWEHDNLDKDGGTTRIEELIDTSKDVFGLCREACEKYSYLFDKYPLLPHHDLETWKYFFLDADGGTTKIRKRNSLLIFTDMFYGGEEAKEKYENLCTWERRNLNDDGTTLNKYTESDLLEWGIDIFHGAPEARAKYEHFLNAPSLRFENDLATWERIWLVKEEKHGRSRMSKVLKRMKFVKDPPPCEGPFNTTVFGASLAAEKYQSLCNAFFELIDLDVDGQIKLGNTIAAKLSRGRDIFQGEEFLRSEIEYLLPVSRRPRHDLETWEYYHRSEDEGATAIETRIQVFQVHFYGAVEARREYGFLLSKEQRKERREGVSWDTRPLIVYGDDTYDTDVVMEDVSSTELTKSAGNAPKEDDSNALPGVPTVLMQVPTASDTLEERHEERRMPGSWIDYE